jgi:Fe2+ transport system protein FeoA
MKKILLSEMTVGQVGKIFAFEDESAEAQRIEEMGVTPGEEVEIIRFAPMGDPIEIKIRGYLLTLRKQEADTITVSI